MQDVVIVRHGEIGIKSRTVRNRFEKVLIDNISVCLKNNKVSYDKITRSNSRVYIFAKPTKKMLDSLKRVFGIVSFSPAKIIKTEIKSIEKEALTCYKSKGRKKSFRITARRQTKEFEFNSRQICEIVGEYVQKATGAKVNLSKPEINVSIEVNGKNTFVLSEHLRGQCGLPIGTQEKVLCVISDNDSIIAALEALKRGCTAYLFFENKTIAKRCKHVMDRYYYHRTPLSFSFEEPAAKDIGAYAIVYGTHDLNVINSKQKDDVLLLFPLLGYSKNELKQKIADLK